MAVSGWSATRYLASSAFLKIGFADMFLRRVFSRDYKTKGPAYGLDLLEITRWCIAAQSIERKRVIVRRILFVIAALFLPFSSTWSGSLAIMATIYVGIIEFYYHYRINFGDLAAVCLDPEAGPKNDVKVAPEETTALAALQAEQNGNVCIYGGFTPFVGAGLETLTWSVAISLKPKSIEGVATAPPPTTSFVAADVYDAVIPELEALRIPRFQSREVICVPGNLVRNIPTLFDSASLVPNYSTDPSRFGEDVSLASSPVRVYRLLQIGSVRSDVIVNYFFRTTVTAETLFVEVSSHLNLPINSSYRTLDQLPRRRKFLTLPAMFLEALFTAPLLFAYDILMFGASVFRVVSDPLSLVERSRYVPSRKTRQYVLDNPMYDFGATQGIRDVYGAKSFDSYAQLQDAVLYNKMLDSRLLDMLLEFLERKNVDTSDFRSQKSTIINTGVIVSGTLTAGAVAVGQGSQAAARGNVGAAAGQVARSVTRESGTS